MTIEGLGKKFQEARRARNLTLDEAARMTKIVGIAVLVIGCLLMKLVLNVQRLAPGRGESTAQVSPSASAAAVSKSAATTASPATVAAASSVAPTTSAAPTIAPTAVAAA